MTVEKQGSSKKPLNCAVKSLLPKTTFTHLVFAPAAMCIIIITYLVPGWEGGSKGKETRRVFLSYNLVLEIFCLGCYREEQNQGKCWFWVSLSTQLGLQVPLQGQGLSSCSLSAKVTPN